MQSMTTFRNDMGFFTWQTKTKAERLQTNGTISFVILRIEI
jgi:hypothetical protein